MNDDEIKKQIQDVLTAFSKGGLYENSTRLFNVLGYHSTRYPLQHTFQPDEFLKEYNSANRFKPEKALVDDWQSIDFIFQITDTEISTSSQMSFEFDSENQVDDTIINSYLFLALELDSRKYTRTELAEITRQINKAFDVPVMLLFKYGELLTFAVIDRRLNKIDSSKDVLKKVTLIKDINIENPHRAHIEILFDLSLKALYEKQGFSNFVELHHAWQKTLDTSELNKTFFKELSNWYFWALQNVTFPNDAGKDKEVRNATSVIRLLTRLIFIWFIKEKGLVPDELFVKSKLDKILKYDDPKNSTYYKAILQNLFFATLNQEMNTPEKPNNRRFRGKSKQETGRDQHYGITNLYRYEDYFQNPSNALELFSSVPFLNGGLFECLDKPDNDDPKTMRRIDGFSEHQGNVLYVPDFLFFSPQKTVDLSETFGEAKVDKVRGLINLLYRYKFTINENTPIEEEVALDPELLGKVFENLLASYNPETRTTARKSTGSYYTPREIVNFMVDESLITHLTTSLRKELPEYKDTDGLEEILREIFAYKERQEEGHYFNDQETNVLIKAIDNIKVLDPACGSGAFPMGILHKLVFILGKLDPHNNRWKERQLANAQQIEDPDSQESAIEAIEESFKRNEMDYGRKLYLIQNCVYGVDIQPIAAQIAKLRFFISLIVDQKTNDSLDNRGILPLPNLETKFVAANSVIELDDTKRKVQDNNQQAQQGVLRSPAIMQKEDELKKVRQRHFAARSQRQKLKCREEDTRLRAELADLLVADGMVEESAGKLASWDPYDQNESAGWFNPEWMFDVSEGFDVVIANPPYIKEYTNRSAFDGVRDSPYYKGKMDIWYMFACQAVDHLQDKGVVTFIAQNNWVTSHGASKLRNKVITDTRILTLLDFGDYKIFESSGIQTMVMIFQKNKILGDYIFDFRRILNGDVEFLDIIDLLNKVENENVEYLMPEIDRKSLLNQLLTFSVGNVTNVTNKIKSAANFFLDASKEVAQGIVFPQDKLNSRNQSYLGDDYIVGEGIFVLNDDEKDNIPFTAIELSLIKPSYTTKELYKWYGNPENREWVIYTDSSFKYPENIIPYPNIQQHLDQFSEVITSDNHPYGLHRAREERFFQGEKIIAVRKCAEPRFTYTDFDCYVSATFFVIKTKRINLKYLTALLNSKLIAFWLKHKGKMQGNNYQIDKEPLLSIPIYKPSEEEQTPIIQKVAEILLLAEANNYPEDPNSVPGIEDLEDEIDRLIYELYGLSDDEIAIVEGSS